MFTTDERGRLRAELLERAANDPGITGAAITGSVAAGREDRWSDIDLAFGVSDAVQVADVLADWTVHMYSRHAALHHVDVRAGAWIYRVFLLSNTLQVDLAFTPAAEFRGLGPAFQLVSGRANEAVAMPETPPAQLIGMAWLYALHARSSIARGHLWQAEYMVSGVRDHALALACLRHGLPAVHGRGIDGLPCEVTAHFEGSLVGSLTRVELLRAFRQALKGLIAEIDHADQGLAERLREPLRQLGEFPG